jgi:hypothetical protein
VKLVTGLTIACALAVAGCGGSGESPREHRVNDAVAAIRSIDHINHMRHAEPAEFEGPLRREALAYLEEGASPAVAREACEEIRESPFCKEVIEAGNFQAATPADPRVLSVEAKLIRLIDKLHGLEKRYEATNSWRLLRRALTYRVDVEESFERERSAAEVVEACEEVRNSVFCGSEPYG